MAKSFGTIKNLTLISLSFLVERIHFLSEPTSELRTLVDLFHLRIKQAKNRNRRKVSLENHLAINEPFEAIVASEITNGRVRHLDYVKGIVKALGMTENLPDN